MLVQLARRICASCEAGVNELVLPKGEVIIVDTARFSLLGVLLKEKARPTCKNTKNVFSLFRLSQLVNECTFRRVLAANLKALLNVLTFTSLMSTSNSSEVRLSSILSCKGY